MASKRKVKIVQENLPQVREITLGCLSIEQLCIVTGKTRKTVQQKIAKLKPERQDKKGFYYSTKEAVAAIMVSDADKLADESEAQLLKEKLKLESNKAEKIKLQVDLLKNEALRVTVIEAVWTKMLSTFKAKFLSIPTKISLELVGQKEVHFIEDRLREVLHEALSELKEFRLEHYIEESSRESPISSSAAAEADG
jgi:hypothetical protein